MSDIPWDHARAAMLLDPAVTQLNTGSFGPLSRPVFERVTELRAQLAAGPTDFFVRRVPPLLWPAREQLATFLGGDPRRLVFSTNVSTAINLVAATLRLAGPGEILLSDHEYRAMHWCWERAAIRQRLTLRTFPLPHRVESPDEIVSAAVAAMSSRTRLLFLSHVVSPTGLVVPVAAICREARRHGILTVVDGAHAVVMRPVNVTAIGADFYCGNCHKWLLAPTGCGFVSLGPGMEDRVQPVNVSWGWHYDRNRADEPDEFGSTPRIRSLEFEGTRDVCPWLTVPTALAFQERLGWERIRERIAELAAHVRRRFPGLERVTPDHPELAGALTAFRLPADVDPVRLRERLWAERIEVPIFERPEGLLLRLSTHWYTTEADVDRLAEVWPEALAAARRS